jgi:thiol-disulfide isomerase/thioredoxin
MPCLAAKPIVNGIESDLEGKAKVIRLNVIDQMGREAAGRYDVSGLPTTLVLDGGGRVVHRQVGIPNRKKIVAEAVAGT